jgi:diguanylate cyclase (GGDEF)-like protein
VQVVVRKHQEKPEGIASDDYRMYVVISYLTYLGITVHLTLIPFFFWLDYKVLAAFNVLSSAAWLLARTMNHRGKHTLAIIVLISEVSLHTSLALYYFGWHSGFQYYLMAGVPFLLFNHRMKTAPLLIMSALLCILFMGLYALTSAQEYQFSNPLFIEGMNYANMATSFIALTVTSYYFRVASFISEQQMELVANADLLTGLPNRRGIYGTLNAQHDLFTRKGTIFSVVLADVDHFKLINDTYGHDGGDYVLKELSHLLKKRIRQYDVVARWGGEEFLFMFPDTEAQEAMTVAEDLRKVIESHRFVFNDHPIYVTMTFGVAQHTKHNSIDGTIKHADDALYEGKAQGRNRVVVAPHAVPGPQLLKRAANEI